MRSSECDVNIRIKLNLEFKIQNTSLHTDGSIFWELQIPEKHKIRNINPT